ncbi:MAG: outer membrane lipoprotein carrier protein LolA [Candidatus Parabeggiatoa sp. nov. 3]|nr:MAG: outer membrane lipoprotein carrier protein LolA [Gammaproteobacteria bacterium]RKZ69508.1 MAG: outer membrane lipoprotein carrier protein LolA [Gammaproteobacteria bacterium]RKZ90122.1 MAG: outer membrane lipoprotein carrier protein LolA [Gammaproteobacteria bacterium]
MKLHWLLFLLGCLPNWLYAAQSHEELNQFLQSLQTVYAQFNQKLYNESGQLLEESSGKMYVQRPNQFRWEYLQPYNQLLVADGKQVWIYDSDLEQVTVKALNAALGKTPAFLLSRNRKLEEDFFVNKLPFQPKITRFELIPKDEITRFELIPKDAEAQFDSMRINLQGDTILGFELLDNLGQTTHINFSQVRQNLRFRKSLFKFTPPAGVDILKEN